MTDARPCLWVAWLPAAVWAALIWLASSFAWGSPPVELPRWVPADKIAHAAIFGVLAWLCARPLGGKSARCGRRALLRAWLLATLWGALDEWHQSWVPGRFSDVRDAVADTMGAAVGVLLWGCVGAVRAPGWRAGVLAAPNKESSE